MGVITYEQEIKTCVPPARMFKAFVLESDTLIPKMLPQAIKSVEILEGDGGAGTIKKITFGEGSQYSSVKHQIQSVDKEKLTFEYSVIEGDALSNVLEKICNEIKFEESGDGGCICKGISKYHTLGDAQIKEEDIKAGKEKALGMFKAIESYLVANPEA